MNAKLLSQRDVLAAIVSALNTLKILKGIGTNYHRIIVCPVSDI